MSSEQERLLNAHRLPLFLSRHQLALLFGLEDQEIDILLWLGELQPLGGAQGTEKKQFSSRQIEIMLDENPDWPDKARRAIINFHRRKNATRIKNSAQEIQRDQLESHRKAVSRATRNGAEGGCTFEKNGHENSSSSHLKSNGSAAHKPQPPRDRNA